MPKKEKRSLRIFHHLKVTFNFILLKVITPTFLKFLFHSSAELFPHIFTWACDPKEASARLIKRYITQHFPNLSPEVKLKKAIESMTKRGLLEQITGMYRYRLEIFSFESPCLKVNDEEICFCFR